MAELLRGRPALTVEWMTSVGLDLLSTANLVIVVHDYEGLGSWLLEAYSMLPTRLRRDLELVLRATNHPPAIVEALANELLDGDRPGHTSAPAFFADLAALDEPTCARLIEAVLIKSMTRHNITSALTHAELLADTEALEALISEMRSPVEPSEVAQLLRAPGEWRDLVVSSLQRFWDRVYREQWTQTYAQLERSVEQHRRQSYPSDLAGLFTAVTGRQIPDGVRPRLADIEHARFVPSLYLGPYVSFLFNDSTVTIFYNGQGTPRTDTAGPPIDDLYHPLTALADKTRLAIMAMLSSRELYAQEIVDRLGISQSAVSRHLQLMVDMKVLNVRRGERGAKFYSINSTALHNVAKRLSEFR